MTIQMLYLLETPVGIALFNESTLISKMVYPSSHVAVESVKKLNAITDNSHTITDEIDSFLTKNLSPASDVNTLSPELVSLLRGKYKVNAVCQPDDEFRKLRTHAFKWFDLNKDVYNAMALRISHKLIHGVQSDVQVVSTLNTIEEMDKSINNRVMRIREWYSLHFPELNTVSDNFTYLKYIMEVGNRKDFLNINLIINDIDGINDGNINEPIMTNDIPENVRTMAANSMGVEITAHDVGKIKNNAQDILKDMKYRTSLLSYLKNKCQESFPSLFCLIGEVLMAKLIKKVGSISKLASMPSSTIQILGAEKAFNEAVKNMGNTPKYGIIFESKYISRASSEHKGRIARALSNKIALCARVDLQYSTSGDAQLLEFGKKTRIAMDKIVEKLEDHNKVEKKSTKMQKRKFISVKEYDQSRDGVKHQRK